MASTSTGRRSSRKVARVSYEHMDSSGDESAPAAATSKPRRKRAKVATDDESVAEDELESPATQKSLTKRCTMKRASNPARKKRGVLQELVGLPLDILYEVFSHLTPKDLLALSRTTKDLRAVLATRSSKSIWMAARENVPGLPPCPSDLNEVQYANLMFSNHCHHCLSPHSLHSILWMSRARACSKCFENLYSVFEIDMAGGDISDVLPMDRLFDKRGKGQQSFPGKQELNGTPEGLKLFFLKSNATVLLDTVTAKKESGVLADWYKEQSEALDLAHAHASLCEKWIQANRISREDELKTLHEERRKAIFARLADAGWEDELTAQAKYRPYNGLRFLTDTKYFKDTRPVSDRVWKNMETPLIALMEEHRAKRLAEKLRDTWRDRHRSVANHIQKCLDALPLETPRPPIGTISLHPPIHATLHDTPIEDAITTEMVDKLLEDLPAITELWLTNAKNKLVQLLRDSPHYPDDATLDDLDLATVMFECIGCRPAQHLFYPEVLYHKCHGGPHSSENQHDFIRQTYNEPWTESFLKVRRTEPANSIVRACGLDPRSATVKDMQELNPFLEFQSEDVLEMEDVDLPRRRSIYGWRQAIKICTAQRFVGDGNWVMLDAAETAKAKALQEPFKLPDGYDRTLLGHIKFIVCTHCKKTFEMKYRLRRHLKKIHAHDGITPDDWRWHPLLQLDDVVTSSPVFFYPEGVDPSLWGTTSSEDESYFMLLSSDYDDL